MITNTLKHRPTPPNSTRPVEIRSSSINLPSYANPSVPYLFRFGIHSPPINQLNYHLYSAPIPETFSHTHFLPDALREELQQRSETTRTAPALGFNLPEELQGYHTLVPLENIGSADRRKFGSWFSTVYRATNSTDGIAYVLRRIESECVRMDMCGRAP